MISLGRWGKGWNQPAWHCHTPLSRCHLHLSVFSSPLSLCLPLNLFFLPFPRGNASIHLCLYCHPHTFNCHSKERSSLNWWKRVRVTGVHCPHFPPKMKPNNVYSTFVHSGWKNAWDVFESCRRNGEEQAGDSIIYRQCRKKIFSNQLSALAQSQVQ